MAVSHVVDATDATFATLVLEASNQKPVVVDFWAPWCGPCRALGPLIERVAAEQGDAVQLVKLNTDDNPRTASQYRIQGIPAVKAYRNGQVVAEFTGALPEPQVRAFFAKLAPSPVELALRQADTLAGTDPASAERLYREALSAQPTNASAVVGLAGLLVRRGERAEAQALLGHVPTDRRAKVMKHRLFLEEFADRHANENLEGEAQASPRDPRARYRLGLLLAAKGDYERALDELLESVRLDRSFADDAARKGALAIFEILGLDSPVTRDYQRRLTSVLF